MSTFHGRFALGQKTSSTQEPGLLGDERDDIVFRYDSDTGMYYNTNSGRVRVKWVQNTSGGALKPGSVVAWDTSGSMDTNVIQSTDVTVPCGIVDPFLTADVADDERFLIVTKASRIKALTGGNFSKGAALVSGATGKVVSGVGSRIRALAANAGGADQLVEVSCDFSSVGDVAPTQARVHRARFTIAQVNAGATILAAVPGYSYRLHDASMISVGGAAATATSVDILGTQSASSVKLVANAVAGLTQNTLLRAGAANSTILAAGASFVACDANTAITIGKTGSNVATATDFDVLLTYELVAA